MVDEVDMNDGGLGERRHDTRSKKTGRKQKGERRFGLRKTESQKEKAERQMNFLNWTRHSN